MEEDASGLTYEAVEPLDSSRTYKLLLSQEKSAIVQAILTISWHDDWKFAQDVCLKFARHEDVDVRNISIVGLGHVARNHGAIEIGSVLELVGDLRRTGRDHGCVEDMFGDVMVFVARQGRRAV